MPRFFHDGSDLSPPAPYPPGSIVLNMAGQGRRVVAKGGMIDIEGVTAADVKAHAPQLLTFDEALERNMVAESDRPIGESKPIVSSLAPVKADSTPAKRGRPPKSTSTPDADLTAGDESKE